MQHQTGCSEEINSFPAKASVTSRGNHMRFSEILDLILRRWGPKNKSTVHAKIKSTHSSVIIPVSLSSCQSQQLPCWVKLHLSLNHVSVSNREEGNVLCGRPKLFLQSLRSIRIFTGRHFTFLSKFSICLNMCALGNK